MAIEGFTQLGIPSFYKLDKLQYQRGEVADLGVRLLKKCDAYESFLSYERNKNEQLEKEKIDYQQQIERLHIEAA
jgi:hypothetical protein